LPSCPFGRRHNIFWYLTPFLFSYISPLVW
jgi:hypothetical protein